MKISALVGQKIRHNRKALSFTQIMVSKITKINRTSLALIEQGKQLITVDKLVVIALALRIPISSLLPNQNELNQLFKIETIVVDGIAFDSTQKDLTYRHYKIAARIIKNANQN